jgi:hypothetical protein
MNLARHLAAARPPKAVGGSGGGASPLPPSRTILVLVCLLALAGCGVLIDDEITVDPLVDTRPSAVARTLREDVARMQASYQDMIVRATQQERRRLPSIGSELSRLADAAAALEDDLTGKRGAFDQHLGRATNLATSINDQLTGGRLRPDVSRSWLDVRESLRRLRQLHVQLGTAGLYREQDAQSGPTRIPLGTPAAAPRYDVSFEVDQVRRGYDGVMKAWRDAPARRTTAAWTRQLDQELTALRDPVDALGRVDTGSQAAVAPAADRVRAQLARVQSVLQLYETELPRSLLEEWARLSGWARDLGK